MKEKTLFSATDTGENQIRFEFDCETGELLQIAARLIWYINGHYGRAGLDKLEDLTQKYACERVPGNESEAENESD